MRFIKQKYQPYYCEVEYLQSSGTQYIDTLENDTTGYFYKTAIEPLSSGAWVLWFGRQETSTGGNCDFVGYNGDTKLGASVIQPGVGNTIGAQTAPINTLYKIESSSVVSDVYFTANGVKTTASRSGSVSSKNAYIFCINNAGTANNFVSMRLYYFQMRDKDNILVRDFIPVLDWDMTPCLYDKVSGQLFYNQGTGSFTTGRQIHYVDYLESTGTQYIDTGYAFTSGYKAKTTFEIEDETQVGVVFGSFTSNRNFLWKYASSAYSSQGKLLVGAGAGGLSFNPDDLTKKTTYECSNIDPAYLKENGTSLTVFKDTISYSYNNRNFYVFCMNSSGTADRFLSIKLYDLMLWDYDETLVRDYKPAADENGVGFMFDRVEHKIYDNAGTGSFVFNQPEEANPSPIRLLKQKHTPYYCEVEYLESSGTQYIDTGINYAGTSDVITLGIAPMQATGDVVFIGAYVLSPNAFVELGAYNGKYRGNIQTPADIPASMTYTVGVRNTLKFTTNGWWEFNGNQCGITKTDPVGVPFYLFRRNYESSPKYSSARIYNLDITRNGVKILDMIPVLDWNMVPCMYDKVSNKLFYNKGTGSFTYGRQIHYVDYLESTGTQYIDTGFIPTEYTRTIAKLYTEETGNKNWFGILDSNYGTGSYVFDSMSPTSIEYVFGRGNWTTVTVSDVVGKQFIVDFGKEGIYINDTKIDTPSATFSTGTNSMAIFVRKGGSAYISGRCYWLEIIDNGNTIRSYKPAVDENGVGFLFDEVEHKVYLNAGTGAFKYPNVELEYLESTGTQYIDTGVLPSNSLTFDVTFQNDGPASSPGYGNVFGSRTGSATSDEYFLRYEDNGMLSLGGIRNSNLGMILGEKYRVTYDGNTTATINGIKKTVTAGTIPAQTAGSIFLFCNRYKTNPNQYQPGKIFRAKFGSNLDLVPMLKNGVAGMLDTVNDVFYTNLGTGTFNFRIKEKKIPVVMILYTDN